MQLFQVGLFCNDRVAIQPHFLSFITTFVPRCVHKHHHQREKQQPALPRNNNNNNNNNKMSSNNSNDKFTYK